VRYFQREEFSKCGCNRKWIYYHFENLTDIKICSKFEKCDFKFESYRKFSNRICGKNCQYKYYYSGITSQNGLLEVLKKTYAEKFIPKFIIMDRRIIDDISFTHFPKMTLIEYFCSIGGLFSMWFGISLFHLIVFVYEKLTDFIGIYFQRLNSLINKSIQLFSWLKFLKYQNKFKLLLILIFSTVMFYQISDIIRNYLKYDTLTRFEINEKNINPGVIFSVKPKVVDIKRLIKIYPEIKGEKKFNQIKRIRDEAQRNDLFFLIFYLNIW
jgi:hypothetical protein